MDLAPEEILAPKEILSPKEDPWPDGGAGLLMFQGGGSVTVTSR